MTAQQAPDLFLTREVAVHNYPAAIRRTYTYDLREFLRILPDNATTSQLTLAQLKQYLALLDQRSLSSAA